eukprot:gene31622-6816_t
MSSLQAYTPPKHQAAPWYQIAPPKVPDPEKNYSPTTPLTIERYNDPSQQTPSRENAAPQSCIQMSPGYRLEDQSMLHLFPTGLGLPMRSEGAPRTSFYENEVPRPTMPLQPKLLKMINSISTKEELLAYVASYHMALDTINLVTCVYRLARMSSQVRTMDAKAWSSQLWNNAIFQLLLRTIHAHVLAAQLTLLQNEKIKGLDSRCVSNLVWSMIKLDMVSDPEGIGADLVHSCLPIVVHFSATCSSQGLANLLWGYSKMPMPPTPVMMHIVKEMTIRLSSPQAYDRFDAQALSNSTWALAHLRLRMTDLDAAAGSSGTTMRFLMGVASCATAMVATLETRIDHAFAQSSMTTSEKTFSCQAMVNIAWSIATLMGEECSMVPSIKSLFLAIRHESVVRLRATSNALDLQLPWVHKLQGGFNEQALSNTVYAYDKAKLLDDELLQWVFYMAALRLESGFPAFKRQELSTLLRAAERNPNAQPWRFLHSLKESFQRRQHGADGRGFLSEFETAEMDNALAMLRHHTEALAIVQFHQILAQQVYSANAEQGRLEQNLQLHLNPPTLDQENKENQDPIALLPDIRIAAVIVAVGPPSPASREMKR